MRYGDGVPLCSGSLGAAVGSHVSLTIAMILKLSVKTVWELETGLSPNTAVDFHSS